MPDGKAAVCKTVLSRFNSYQLDWLVLSKHFWLEANDEEQCRKVLFDEIVSNPKELVEKLQ